MIVCPLRVSPAVHSLSALPFPVLSRYRPQEKQVFLPMALWFCSMTWLKLPSYMFFRRSFSRSVYLRSYLCYLLLWDLSSVSGWSFLLFGLLTWSLEGYIATWFFLIGTQQDLSRFLLPTVSADCCCDRRWWLCALIPQDDPGFPRCVPSFKVDSQDASLFPLVRMVRSLLSSCMLLPSLMMPPRTAPYVTTTIW